MAGGLNFCGERRSAMAIGECMVEFAICEDGRYTKGFGGDTLNTAIYLARLGVATEYVTALGTDPASDAMLADWHKECVGTTHVLRTDQAGPGLYVIETDMIGERRFLYWRGQSAARLLPQLSGFPAVAAALANAGAVYLSGVTLALYNDAGIDILFGALDAARAAGARIVFDANVRPRLFPSGTAARRRIEAMFSRADLVLGSLEDIALLLGTDTLDAADARAFLASFAVTETVLKCEDRVVEIGGGDTGVRIQGEPAPFVADTTAAGDSFAAAYLAARLAGAPPRSAAVQGHALARIVVQHRGAIIPREAMLSTIGQ